MFNKIEQKNVFIYGSIIGGFIANKKYEDALFYFEDMKKKGIIPNNVIYILILKISSETKNLELGKQLHDEIIKTGIKQNIELQDYH